MAEETAEKNVEMAQPIIVDLGKQRPGKVKALKKGKGKLWDDVLGVVEEAKELLGDEANGKVLIPIIILCEKKTRRSNIEKLMFPLIK